MQNNILKDLLKQYEEKRNIAIKKLESRKNSLYEKNPELKNIEENLNQLYLKKSKYILLNKSTEEINLLDNKIISLKNKKQSLINNLNIEKNYLLLKYECQSCNDTGYISDENGLTTMCSCLKQQLFNVAYNKSNIGNLDKENFDNFNLKLFSDEINLEKYNSKISPRENIKYIKKICLNFISNFDDSNEKNLLFTGNTGLRKNIFI